jgi:hypothetical protein
MSRNVAGIKAQAFLFVEEMFGVRGYSNITAQAMNNDSWFMTAKKPDGEKILAMFTTVCKHELHQSFSTVAEMDLKDEDEPEDNKQSKTTTGKACIEKIAEFSRSLNCTDVIIASDNVTHYAITEIDKIVDIRFTIFSYEEMGIRSFKNHELLPYKNIRLATAEELKRAGDPNNMIHYNVKDSAIKYFGMKVDDVIVIEDGDRVGGISIEYGAIKKFIN